jgi:hypothetical protein
MMNLTFKFLSLIRVLPGFKTMSLLLAQATAMFAPGTPESAVNVESMPRFSLMK